MNWDKIEANWKVLSGKARERWGKLTDDDIDKIAGKREQLEGRLQALYGTGREETKRQVDDFLMRFGAEPEVRDQQRSA